MSPMDNNMSPMMDNNMMGDEQNYPMEDNMMSDEQMSNFEDDNNEQMPSSFDSNFDAGVEADEETDPKKYIQQLTGKLSQTLNSYNNENGEPDTELGKYVLGMLVKQGTKGMDDKDRKEIIKKINTNNTEDDEDFDDETSEQDDNIDENPEMSDDMVDNPDNMQMESKIIKCTKKQIFENFGLTMDNETPKTKTPDTKITKDTIKNRRTRPFEAPKKFKI